MKRERNLPTVLTPQEINAVIEATDNLKHKAIIATMYSSGLRVSEASHACRHSFASHLFESGVDIKYIQSLLGHVDPRSTDVYLHVSNKTLLGIRSPFDAPKGGEP